MNGAKLTHLRVPWLRPRSQGGDTASPLCRAPQTGFFSAEAAAWPMSDLAAAVTCGFCRRWIVAGGWPARRLELSLGLGEHKVVLG